MPSTRDLRRRIRSIRNTSQITKAMQMVAASKMRRAQLSALAGRPYAELMNGVLAEVAAHTGDFTHPLMEPNNSERVGVIVVSSDKGLCGALNGNLMREAAKYDKDKTTYISVGRKAAQFVARSKRQLAAEFTYKDAPMFSEARAVSRFAQELFLKGEVGRVEVLYTNFINTLTQKAQAIPFLPVGKIVGVEVGVEGEGKETELLKGATEFKFEPAVDQVLSALLPHYLSYKIYHCFLEAKASEHSARMVAMKNATDNAKQLIKDLTLEYNKIRQASITNELLEITTATMALG